MIKRAWIALILLSLILSACAVASSPMGGEQKTMEYAAPAAPQESPALAMPESDRSMETASSYDAAGNMLAPAERLVIQNAELSVIVNEPAQALAAIAQLAKEMGGYVVSQRSYKTTSENGVEVPRGEIVIRVLAENLDESLNRIKALTNNPAEDVLSENRTGEDVTDRYTDLQSRLRNLEDTEKQLREIMASATRTEDVMAVFNQLSQVRSEIEVIKGQIKFYEESAALSAITVQVAGQEANQPLKIGNWKPVGVAKQAVQALVNTLKFIGNLLIWVAIYLLPVGLIIGLPVWLIVRAVRRGRKKKGMIPPVEGQK